MVFTFTEALALNASSPDFTKKGIDIIGKSGIEATSTQFNEALTDGSFLVLNSKSYTGTGAGITLDITKYLHLITTSASDETITVPDGNIVGQHILIVLESDGGGDVSFSFTSQFGATIADLNDDGESASLLWTGSKWCKIFGQTIADS